MKLVELKQTIHPGSPAPVRGTDAQDTQIASSPSRRRRRLRIYAALAGAVVLIGAFAWLTHAWTNSRNIVSRERLRVATVEKGHFVRDVSAQGVVIASINPTLFAVAPGTISYAVHAGDSVVKGKVLAVLDSPELKNEYERERATLDSLDAALDRQRIEIRRETLTSQQQADISQVSITAAEREMKRAQWAWDQKAISERDYKRSQDDVATAKLNFEHARDTAALEKDSLALELRTKTLERQRQALVAESLKQRVDELTVRSPVDGMVANLAQPEKTKVADSAPLLTVVDLTAFEIEFHVAETYAGEIKAGMAADIALGGRTETGTVTAISPEVRQNEVIGRVKFAKGQPAGLRQNERASVRVVLDQREGVLKFERGSAIDEATRAVYVVRDNRAIRIPVELGAASITEIEALRGLSAGDQVIISDTRDFNDAPHVMIAN